jgi:hypothetical protein
MTRLHSLRIYSRMMLALRMYDSRIDTIIQLGGTWIFKLNSTCSTFWCTALVLRISISAYNEDERLEKSVEIHLPPIARSCRLLSVIPPLVSRRNFFPDPAQRSRRRAATDLSSPPSILSSITTSAPAAMASFASCSSRTSTSRRSEKPPTSRARVIAAVTDPRLRY